MLSRSSPSAQPPASPPGSSSSIQLPASVSPAPARTPSRQPASPATSSPRQRRDAKEQTAAAASSSSTAAAAAAAASSAPSSPQLIPLRRGLPEGASGLNIQLDGTSGVPIIEQLAEALAAHHGRVIEVFREWDGDGSGTISKAEFRQGLSRLGLRDVPDQQAHPHPHPNPNPNPNPNPEP